MSRREAVFFCAEQERDEFLAPYVAALAGDRDWSIRWEDRRDSETVATYQRSADLLWFDHFDDALVALTRQLSFSPARVICRFCGTEFLDHKCDECRWEFFDDLVTASESTFQILANRYDRLSSYCAAHLLPVAIDPGPEVELSHRQGNKLALTGRISMDLNSQMLLQVMAALGSRGGDFQLHIAGAFDKRSTQIYFEHLMQSLNLGGRVFFGPPPADQAAWFADKDIVISTALCPGREAGVFKAMAAGLRPVVHDFYGAREFYGEENVYASVDGLVDLLTRTRDGSIRAKSFRRFVVDNHNIATFSDQFLGICSGAARENNPQVSIAVPTYNRAHLLGRALENFTEQEYPALEIVISDDCSSDDTESLVHDWQASHGNILYTRNERNLGPCHNTARAVAEAHGDYVLVCSDDDLLDRDAVRRYVDLAVRKKADLVYSDLGIIDGDGNQKAEWRFRNYYDNHDLLRDLIFSGCNRIPEVFLCRREIFDRVYTETYGRRFLNTYFLPLLRDIRMIHLPEPLYKYTVHQQSTFNTVRGLFDRVKSTQNYINAALLMYSPTKIFETEGHMPLAEQLALAYYRAAAVLAKLGTSFIQGKFYTGVEFKREDKLYEAYFFTACHWLEMARKYGLSDDQYNPLRQALLTPGDPLQFDAVKTLNVPEVYNKLPWFAFRPFNTASSFVALDICTVGHESALDADEYEIYRDEKMSIAVANHIVRSCDELEQTLRSNPVSIINLFDRRLVESVLRYLCEQRLFSVQVLNFTQLKLPPSEVLRNIHNVGGACVNGIEDYLELVSEITAVKYEDSPVQA